jgi:hypothetical protein
MNFISMLFMSGWVRMHWDGDLPLARSFFINFMAIDLTWRLIVHYSLEEIAKIYPTEHLWIIMVLAALLRFPVLIWATVGVWKSSTNFWESDDIKQWRVWTGRLVKLILIYGVLFNAAPYLKILIYFFAGDLRNPDF